MYMLINFKYLNTIFFVFLFKKIIIIEGLEKEKLKIC